MKFILIFFRILTGVIFTLSGFVKAVDPVGTQIKFEDYFYALGLEFLMPFALIFSFLLNAAEIVIGIMLIINSLPKLALWFSLIFISIFIPLTLWLAVYNPVSDCGCFGDALILTNWQTFWKNIIILIFILIPLIYRAKLQGAFKLKTSISLFAFSALLALGFEYYNYTNLPLIDFRPYKVGANIKEGILVPEDAPKDVYESVFLYKNIKTGDLKEFTIDNYPEGNDNWAYDSTITKLISKGYEPPIHDFIITNIKGDDVTNRILNDKNYSLILVSFDLEKSKLKNFTKLRNIADYCFKKNIDFYGFTASVKSSIRKEAGKYPHNIKFCTGDKTMLKTILRSNPGIFILKDGVIMAKYHYSNFPNVEELKDILEY